MMLRCASRRRKVIFRPGFGPFSSFLAMRSTFGSASSWTRLTLLACPDSAGGGLGRAHAVSHGTCCTRSFSRIQCTGFITASAHFLLTFYVLCRLHASTICFYCERVGTLSRQAVNVFARFIHHHARRPGLLRAGTRVRSWRVHARGER